MHTRRIADQGWRSIRQQENARKRDAALRIPSRWAGGSPPLLDQAVILGGNTVFSGSPATVYGIKGVAPLTDVASAPPAYVSGATASGTDGVGYARRLRDNAIVLVVNDANGQALIGDPWGAESVIYLQTLRTLTVGGGPSTISVWTVV